MSEIHVKTGKDETARNVVVNYDIPGSTAELVAKYGEEQTHALASRAITLAVQALVRQKAAAGASDEDCQNAVNEWVPGVRGPVTRKSPLERASAALQNMSPEDIQALLAKVKAAAKGQPA